MKITKKTLENIIKEEIEKAGVNDPMRVNRTFSAPLRSEIEKEPVAGYIMQMLQPYMDEINEYLNDLSQRVEELENKTPASMADSTRVPSSLKENKENPMKITRKILENIIKEELSSVMQPSAADSAAQGARRAMLPALDQKEQELEKIIAQIKAFANKILSQEPTSEREKAIHELAKLIKIENDPTKLAKLQLAIAFMGYNPLIQMGDETHVDQLRSLGK